MACLQQLFRVCIIQPMKALMFAGLLVLSLGASGQKSAENAPGVLLHGDGKRGTLRVVLIDRNGEPARHVAVMVFWSCHETCPIVESSMLTNGVGEFQLDPITVGKYIVCSNSDVGSSLPCVTDLAATSCTVEIAPEYPKVELRMQIPQRGITPPERHEQVRCRQTATSSH